MNVESLKLSCGISHCEVVLYCRQMNRRNHYPKYRNFFSSSNPPHLLNAGNLKKSAQAEEAVYAFSACAGIAVICNSRIKCFKSNKFYLAMMVLFAVTSGIDVIVAAMLVAVGLAECVCHGKTQCAASRPFAD